MNVRKRIKRPTGIFSKKEAGRISYKITIRKKIADNEASKMKAKNINKGIK